MKKPTTPEALVKAAVETAYLSGLSLEDAQVYALTALSKIASATGPKNLQRLIAENRLSLIADRAVACYEIPAFKADCEEWIAVPRSLAINASSWLMELGGAEERRVGEELYLRATGQV
jgi:hypothetical protein